MDNILLNYGLFVTVFTSIILYSSMLSKAEVLNFPLKKTHLLLNEAVSTREASEEYESQLKGKPGLGYYIDIGIGTPSQTLSVLVDTGSSNFAVAASAHPYVLRYFDAKNSSSFENLSRDVEVPYTQGKWHAFLGRDWTSINAKGTALSVIAEVACITSSYEFFINGSEWQGILGLAYRAIAQPDSSVTPFFDSLRERRSDILDVFAMQLCSTVDTEDSMNVGMGGTLTIGGIDNTLFNGPIHYVPIHKEWYYEVVISDIAVAGQSLNMDCKEYNFDKTIVDSGTTNLRLPRNVFLETLERIKRKVTLSQPIEEGFWSRDIQLCWEQGQTPWSAFPNMTISLYQSSNSTIDLAISPQQYLRAVPDDRAGGRDCFKFSIDTSATGSVIGAVIMEGYYVIFDRENQRMGFAETNCALRDTTYISTVKGPFPPKEDLLECAYHRPEDKSSSLIVAAYVMAGLCGICTVPLLIMICQWIWFRIKLSRSPPSEGTAETGDINSLLPDDEFESSAEDRQMKQVVSNER